MTKLTTNKLIIIGNEDDIESFYNKNIKLNSSWIPYIYNTNIYEKCLIIKFDSNELPMSWLISITEKNSNLTFKLWNGNSDHNISTQLVYKNGIEVYSKLSDYNTYIKHQWCDMCYNFVFEEDPGLLDSECLMCGIIALDSYFLKFQLEQATRKIAIMRIARNPLTQNYLLRKIFIPRLSEILI